MMPHYNINQGYVIRDTRLALDYSKTGLACIAVAQIAPGLSCGWAGMAGGRYQCILICLARYRSRNE